jgi:hypothetical protein
MLGRLESASAGADEDAAGMIQLLLTILAIALTAAITAASIHYAGPAATISRDQIYAIELLNSAQQAQISAYDDADGANGKMIPPPKVAQAGAQWQSGKSLVWIQLDPAKANAVCDRVVKMGGVRDYDDAWVDDVAAAFLDRERAGYGCFGVGTVVFAIKM